MVIGLGQVLSGLICGTALSSEMLSGKGINMPTGNIGGSDQYSK